jgi:hypothetical protein
LTCRRGHGIHVITASMLRKAKKLAEAARRRFASYIHPLGGKPFINIPLAFLRAVVLVNSRLA